MTELLRPLPNTAPKEDGATYNKITDSFDIISDAEQARMHKNREFACYKRASRPSASFFMQKNELKR